jgi:hypothetical protein
MKKLAEIFVACVGIVLASGATAQQAPAPASAPAAKPLSTSLGLVVFPAKGQTAQVQSQDEGECYAWSKGQTGIDPMAPAAAPTTTASAPTTSQQPQSGGGERVRGAARGAAAGAVIGEVANDDASDGAAIGATVGVLKGGAEKRKKQQQAAQQQATAQQQAATQQQQANQQQRDQFNKGFGACLEAKGYTVK